MVLIYQKLKINLQKWIICLVCKWDRTTWRGLERRQVFDGNYLKSEEELVVRLKRTWKEEKVTLLSQGTGIMLFFTGFALLFISLTLITECTWIWIAARWVCLKGSFPWTPPHQARTPSWWRTVPTSLAPTPILVPRHHDSSPVSTWLALMSGPT